MTMMTAVAPGGACPLWHKFLDTVTGGDAELQEVPAGRQRLLADRLDAGADPLFFYGRGQNGKTVFIQTSPA